MNRTIAATLLFSTLGVGVVLAQTTTSPSSAATPAVTTNSANTTAAAPVAGANSFTMAQAQKRLEDQGYTQVSALAKDDKSIWRGHAMKNGKAEPELAHPPALRSGAALVCLPVWGCSPFRALGRWWPPVGWLRQPSGPSQAPQRAVPRAA